MRVAPFGAPVVPLVYWMLIGSAGESAASRAASASASTSPARASSASHSAPPSQNTSVSAGSSGRTSSTIAT